MSEPIVHAGATKELGSDNPFPGLRYFRESERQFFIGREAEIDELLRRIKREPLTVLFGISGLGKTSLLLAGIFPRLREVGYFPVRLRLWFDGSKESLSDQIIAQLTKQAVEQGIEVGEKKSGESLWEYFHRVDFWDQLNRRMKPVLVFDQFEEVFTLGRERKDPRVDPFSIELADLIENRIPKKDRRRISTTEDLPYSISEQRYRVVLSLREDFLAELEAWQRLIPSLSNNRMRLNPMTGSAAMRVVTQVPEQVSLKVAEQIVRFVADDDKADLEQLAIEPSLLSVVCRELNNRRISEGLSTITHNLLRGNRQLILEQLYDNCLARFGEHRDALRELVEEHLLTSSSGLRDSVALEDILDEQTGITESALAILVDERLVRIEERYGVRRMELSHDLWTKTIARSRDERHRNEEIEAREQQQRELLEQEKAKTEATNRRLERTRRMRTRILVVSISVVIIMAVTLWVTYASLQETEKAKKQAEELKLVAESERDKANIARQEAVAYHEKLQAAARDTAPVKVALETLREDIESKRSGGEVARSMDYLDSVIEDYRLSVGAREDALADLASVDELFDELGDEQEEKRESALKELTGLHRSDTDALQKALALLQPPATLDSLRSQNIINFLNQTHPAMWTKDKIETAIEILGDTQNETAQLLRSRVYLAAVSNLGRKERFDFLSDMKKLYGNNPIQINLAFDQLEASKLLTPAGRYNVFAFLADSASSNRDHWSTAMVQRGCKLVKSQSASVGPSTRKQMEKMGEGLRCGG